MSHWLDGWDICKRWAQYGLDTLTEGLPAKASVGGGAEAAENCHGSGRSAAHFRPTCALIERLSLRQMGNRVQSMQDATTKKAKNAGIQDKLHPSSDELALHRCYGEIGISAVAAAVRYQGGTKNPAYAPVAINPKP
jgi:hypothetical protein